MTWVSAEWIGGTLFLTLLAVIGWLWKSWAGNWKTRMVAMDNMLRYHGTKIAEHENKHARQDEKNKNVENTLTRIEKGIDGVNSRLDNVIGSNRTSSQ